MNGQAFIGCKISLISRAGIRYEGILYTIDANNSTVALSKVKSFGTEDRYAETPVPPRDEIYEYIIFRGSDIQDLHVCEAPKKQPQIMAQDPAILEITGKPPIPAPYSRRRVQFTSRPYQGDVRDGPFVDDIRGGPYYQPHGDEDVYEPWPERVPSRSYYSRSRPYYPMNSYSVRSQPMFYSEGPPRYNNMRRRPGYPGSGNGIGGNGVGSGGGGNSQRGGSNGNVGVSTGKPVVSTVPAPPRRKNATLRRNTRRSSSLNIRTAKSGGENGGQETSRASSGNSRSTNMSGRPDSQNELNFKYDKDYDFESANAEIAKELERMTLEKNSVSTTTLTDPQGHQQPQLDSANKKGPTGDSERIENGELNSDSQLNGGGLGNGSGSDSDQVNSGGMGNGGNSEMMVNGPMAKDNGDNLINYDKSKSFYDNISSEATDRAKGKMIRAINWRDERKLNVETFGFNISSSGIGGGNNRQNVMRRGMDMGNSVNASNSVNRNVHNMGSYYPPFEVHLPNKYYYQSRWFSRRPDYRVPSYVQAWN